MTRIVSTAKIALGALMALILAPLVAAFGLALLGLALGTAFLFTGGVAARTWWATQDGPRAAGAQTRSADADATAQPA